MTKLKFYALCSRNIWALKRHERTIPKNELVIVINTLDKSFEKEAVTYCIENNIEHYVTFSDGTATTGKNSLFKIFEESDNDYMVQIDGDDFITEHGYFVYSEIAKLESPPDVVGIEYMYGLTPSVEYYASLSLEEFRNRKLPVADIDKIPSMGIRCFYRPNYASKKAKDELCDTWQALSSKYISPHETHIRITFLSKKAVKGRKWPELKVGEDTVFYLENKNLFMEGELSLVHLSEELPTYVYDTRVDGVCEQESRAEQKGAWMRKLVSTMKDMEKEGKLHEKSVPKIKLNFPDNYIANLNGIPKIGSEELW